MYHLLYFFLVPYRSFKFLVYISNRSFVCMCVLCYFLYYFPFYISSWFDTGLRLIGFFSSFLSFYYLTCLSFLYVKKKFILYYQRMVEEESQSIQQVLEIFRHTKDYGLRFLTSEREGRFYFIVLDSDERTDFTGGFEFCLRFFFGQQTSLTGNLLCLGISGSPFFV